jgi:hypothetical protein
MTVQRKTVFLKIWCTIYISTVGFCQHRKESRVQTEASTREPASLMLRGLVLFDGLFEFESWKQLQKLLKNAGKSRAAFHLPKAADKPSMKNADLHTGIIVDRVSEVLDIPTSEIDGVPAFGEGISTDFMLGIGKSQNKVRILLNIDAMLSANAQKSMIELNMVKLTVSA